MTTDHVLTTLQRHASPTPEHLRQRSFAELRVGEVIDSSLEMIELMMNIETDLGIDEERINRATLPSRAAGMTFGQLAIELVQL